MGEHDKMKNFLEMYRRLNGENLHLLKDVYSSDIRFIDPAHEIRGLDDLTEYFSALYQNLNTINFEFRDVIQQDHVCYLQWDMTFCHKRLAGGRAIAVTGATFLQNNDQGMVCYHRDFFDLGAMLYEHLPLLGRLLTTIKGRLGR